jgi:hypothetical protein
LAGAAAVAAAGAAVPPVCANTGRASAVSREATMTDLVFMAISFRKWLLRSALDFA